jgi:hypothetical protein
MIPGTTSKLSEELLASATSISPKKDLVRLTGTTAVATIVPSFGGGFSGILFVVPLDGVVATTTAGNIAVVVSMPQNKVTALVYSKATAKWYPNISA